MDEEKKKISFIINPKSGTQSKEQILHLLDEKLDKAKYVQEVIYTEYAGHAVEIAAQKAKENVHRSEEHTSDSSHWNKSRMPSSA